jgi:hypothetical protein
MASVPTYDPNPYANFDPSQWSNPYSNFQNSAIPFPASYAGWPTDANGNPIRMPPGMTLNSSPAAPPPAPPSAAPPTPQGVTQYNSTGQFGQQAVPYASPGNPVAQPGFNAGGLTSGGQAAAPQAPMPQQAAGPGGLTAQQYLQLRANPGYIATPGATVPQSQTPYQPGSGVLQQFLQNWRPAQSGPGSGFQQQFSKALRGS